DAKVAHDVAMDGAGDYVIVGFVFPGIQVVRCDSDNSCGSVELNPHTGYKFPSTSLSLDGTVNLVWGHGCLGDLCLPTTGVAQRGRGGGRASQAAPRRGSTRWLGSRQRVKPRLEAAVLEFQFENAPHPDEVHAGRHQRRDVVQPVNVVAAVAPGSALTAGW